MKKKPILVFVFIVLVIALVVAVFMISKSATINKIKEQYPAMVNQDIADFLAGSDSTRKYADLTGLQDIQYEITDVFTEKTAYGKVYVLSVEVWVTCEDASDNHNVLMLAYDVMDYCFPSHEYFTLANKKCSHISRFDYDNQLTIYINNRKILPKEDTASSNTTSKPDSQIDLNDYPIKAAPPGYKTCTECSGRGIQTKHYGKSWHDKEGYGYGDTCPDCKGKGYVLK